MLEMKAQCQKCQADLATDEDAYICTYECTFCSPCTLDMQKNCPNCGGELVMRPKRAPASTSDTALV